ncbi:hypothetical protein [Candidatus Marimicrobium litorale]|nr:hypothetical protein [Candidatus Marimicrobium litorale]
MNTAKIAQYFDPSGKVVLVARGEPGVESGDASSVLRGGFCGCDQSA